MVCRLVQAGSADMNGINIGNDDGG